MSSVVTTSAVCGLVQEDHALVQLLLKKVILDHLIDHL